MKRLSKLLFSRMAIVMAIIILQIIAYVFLWAFLSESYLYIHTSFSILGIIILLLVVNKSEPATYKLPWIFILLVLPLYGVIIYGLFGRVNIGKKYIKKFTGIYEESVKYQGNNQDIENKIKEKDLLIASQSKFIHSATLLSGHDNSKSTYFPTGELFFESVVEKLKEAKKYIFLEYFIIEQGKMWDTILDVLKEKIKNGVEVFLIYDDIGCISRLPFEYKKELEGYGLKCIVFNRFIPIVSAIHNNRDHRKIIVIDGKYAYTGGINLADEYINETHPFGKWKDSAVLIEGEAVTNFIIMFIQTYNAHSSKRLNYDKYINEVIAVETDGIIHPFADGPKPFYKDSVGETVYLNIINQAKDYVYINTPYLVVSFHFLNALKNACKRGVDVRIMTPHIPDKKSIYFMTKSNYSDLIEAGVKVYEYNPGFIHAKSFVCDDHIAVVGTINLDYRSFIHHFECGVWMYDCKCINDIKSDFITTCKEEGLKITKENANLKPMQRLIKNCMEIFAPLL